MIQVSGYYKLYIVVLRILFQLYVEISAQFALFLNEFIVSMNKAFKIGCSGEGSFTDLWSNVLLLSKVFFCRRL